MRNYFRRGFACPQVANGGNVLHICKVATNVLNMKSRTADERSFLSSWVGLDVITHRLNKIISTTRWQQELLHLMIAI